jgi:acetyltransferase-like isoleucine patch superfamily enzyme
MRHELLKKFPPDPAVPGTRWFYEWRRGQVNFFFNPAELVYLGHFAIIGRMVRIRYPEQCSIGDYAILDDFTYCSAALTLGCWSHLGANCNLIGGGAPIVIGEFVNIAPGCTLIAAAHDYEAGGLSGPAIPPEYRGASVVDEITLADHVLLGAGTVVLPGVHLPEGVATGALTLVRPQARGVLRKVVDAVFEGDIEYQPWTVYAGIPARAIADRRSDEILAAAERLQEAHG